MKTERVQYTILGRVKARLAKKLIDIAGQLTYPEREFQDRVVVSMKETEDSFFYEIFGDPLSVERFKARFIIATPESYEQVRHYVKTTEPIKPADQQ